jgi:hypothetical protein
VIEPIPEFLVGFVRHFTVRHRIINQCTVGEKNVEASVVIVVEEGDAAAHGLEEIFVRSRGILLLEVDFELLRGVCELNARTGFGTQKGKPYYAGDNAANARLPG